MKNHGLVRNQKGFTLIEIIAVLVLLGILAAVAIPKYLDMTSEAKKKAVDAAVAELNSRENMMWGKVMLSGYSDDATLWSHASFNKSLGSDYDWGPGSPARDGDNTIQFQKGSFITIKRTISSTTGPGSWKRITQ